METNYRNGKQSISNNLEYDNIAQLEDEITNLLNKTYYLGIDGEVYNGLESFRDNLFLLREQYDKERLKVAVQKNKRRVKANGK